MNKFKNLESSNKDKSGDSRRFQDLMTTKLAEYDDVVRQLNKQIKEANE